MKSEQTSLALASRSKGFFRNAALAVVLLLVALPCFSQAPDTLFNYDFEDGQDGWIIEGNVWEIGVSPVVPPSPISGGKLAGTVLNGNYPPNARARLISPEIVLGSLQPGENHFLKFWHWFSFHSGDVGYVQISANGGAWQTVPFMQFDNTSAVWSQVVVDLSAYQNNTIRVAFYFVSDGNSATVSSGWYIDDVSVTKELYALRNPEDFELGVGNWSADNGSWEIGAPTSGPDSTHAGRNVAGTVLGGNYHPNANTRLISPEITLDNLQPGENHLLKFWHRFSFHSGDVGYVQISVNGGAWQTVPFMQFDNTSAVWSQVVVDLSAYQNNTIRVAFYFVSDGNSTTVSTGWYIDDVSVVKDLYALRNPEDFELGVGNWSADNGTWEVGAPTVGPDSTHAGRNVAGTVLNGNYHPNANTRLISPEITLDNLQPGENHLLKFWHWFSFHSGDVGYVQISVNGGAWQTVPFMQFNNTSAVWSQVVVDLSAYQNSIIRVAFYFVSDGNSTTVSTGWYIDDASVVKDLYALRNPEDFELGVGNWSADNGSWEVGEPSAGPSSAHSGKNVAGTVLKGNYPPNANTRLISPDTTLTATPGKSLGICWWQWYSFGSGDVGYLQISVNGGRWQTLWGPKSGNSNGWVKSDTIGLSAYEGATIRFAFYFVSDGNSSSISAGWYVDDISIIGGPPCPRVFSLEPAAIAFGEVPLEQTKTDSAIAKNCGPVAVRVDSVRILGADAPYFSAPPDPFTLQPGESRKIPVCFTPNAVRDFSAILVAYSSAGSDSVGLSGKGIPKECSGPVIFATRQNSVALEPIVGRNGDTIYVDVRFRENPIPIDAFGFKFRFDPRHLDYIDKFFPGNLTADFDELGANENVEGIITVGGYDVTPLPRNSNGVLIRLCFAVTCQTGDTSAVLITDLTDDIETIKPCPNIFACIACLRDGDVNGDGRCTPGDALCAFKIYLHNQILPRECDVPNFECEIIAADVNCDGTVTPGDALAIFECYLKGGVPKEECSSRSVLAGNSREKFYALSLQSTLVERELAGKRTQIFKLALLADQVNGLEAFGLSLSFPHDKLNFIGVERAALTGSWQYLDGISNAAGEVTIGGFNDNALRETGSGEILQVLFTLKGEAKIDLTEFALFDLKDDFARAAVTGVAAQREEAAAPKEFELEQNYPNPFNPTTTITFAIPRPEHVTLRIFDLLGKEVAMLVNERLPAGRYKAVWDAEGMESGIYFYRLQTGSFSQTRKLTLLQ